VPATRPLRILVVDDDPAMVGAITALVGTEGHQVVTAYDGLTAVKRFREEQPDLVLLDLAMPGLPGEKVLETLRRTRPELPVIISSGYSSIESQSAWVAAGASAFVGKPYRIQDLALKMREVLDRARTARGASQ